MSYWYRREENIDMILIFTNIAISTTKIILYWLEPYILLFLEVLAAWSNAGIPSFDPLPKSFPIFRYFTFHIWRKNFFKAVVTRAFKFKVSFSIGNSQKYDDVRFGEYGRCVMTWIFYLARKSDVKFTVCGLALLWWSTYLSLGDIWPFLSNMIL